MSSKSGIYAITNTVNGHRYIGSAVNLPRRWRNHRSLLRNGIHDNIHLQRAWNLYGKDTFHFEIIEECAPEMLIREEQKWLDTRPAYNIARVAGSNLGCRHSEESRARMSVARKGKPSGHKGWPTSEETKAKLSAALKGKKKSPEHSAHIAAAKIGAKLSPETRAKISVARMGNTNAKGHKHSPETRAKIAAAMTGKKRGPHSAKTRSKISAAGLAHWAAKRTA